MTLIPGPIRPCSQEDGWVKNTFSKYITAPSRVGVEALHKAAALLEDGGRFLVLNYDINTDNKNLTQSAIVTIEYGTLDAPVNIHHTLRTAYEKAQARTTQELEKQEGSIWPGLSTLKEWSKCPAGNQLAKPNHAHKLGGLSAITNFAGEVRDGSRGDYQKVEHWQKLCPTLHVSGAVAAHAEELADKGWLWSLTHVRLQNNRTTTISYVTDQHNIRELLDQAFDRAEQQYKSLEAPEGIARGDDAATLLKRPQHRFSRSIPHPCNEAVETLLTKLDEWDRAPGSTFAFLDWGVEYTHTDIHRPEASAHIEVTYRSRFPEAACTNMLAILHKARLAELKAQREKIPGRGDVTTHSAETVGAKTPPQEEAFVPQETQWLPRTLNQIMEELAPAVYAVAGHAEWGDLRVAAKRQQDKEIAQLSACLALGMQWQRCECSARGEVGRQLGWAHDAWCPAAEAVK